MATTMLIFVLLGSFVAVFGAEIKTTVHTKVGDLQSLECSVPPKNYEECHWSSSKHGPIFDDDDFKIIKNKNGECILKFTVKDDSVGTYVCNWDNNQKNFHHFELWIVKLPKSNYIQYKGIHYESGQRIIFNPDDTSLQCISEGGEPKPKIEWHKNNKPGGEIKTTITDDKIISFFTIKPRPHVNSYNFIPNPNFEEEFQCTIVYQKEYGKDYTDVISVWLTYQTYAVTKVEIQGQFPNISCAADGNPTPETVLEKKIKDTWQEVSKEGILQEGAYRCTVTLVNGTQIHSEKLGPNVEESKEPGSASVKSVGFKILLLLISVNFLLR